MIVFGVLRLAAAASGMCLAGWLSVAGAQAPTTVVLPAVTIIEGIGTPPRPSMTIVVREGLIADIFPTGSREPPADARVLPVGGRFVTPGFIDTHVHLAATERPAVLVESLLRASLLGGVTTVRDMGGNGVMVGAVRDQARVDGARSPAIQVAAVFAGPEAFWFTDPARATFLSGGRPPGTAPWLVKVEPATDIRAAVGRAKAWGVDGINIESHLTARQVRQIADEARRARLPVWVHATVGPAGPGDAVDARANTISHADALVWAGRTGLPPQLFGRPAGMTQAMAVVSPDDPAIDDLLGRMRERQVVLEPTLYVGLQTAAFATSDRPFIDAQIAWAAAVTDRARQLGVTVATGTDALGGSSPNLHVEMQLLVERAGFTPLQALRAATFDAARALGLAETVGRVQVGRQADLVVLARDPVADIRNTQTVILVLRAGVVHERTDPMPVPPLAAAPGR